MQCIESGGYWSVRVTVYKINLHTWFIGLVVLNVMVPQPYFFPLTHTRVLFQMMKVLQ